MKWVCVFIIFLFSSLQARVLLITHSYNQPEFIKWQHACFKKFLKDEYEYVVFNDASNEEMRELIESTCKQLCIACYRIPQEIHGDRPITSANNRHCDGIQYSLEQLGFDFKGVVALIDSDMFLIKPFSIEAYLKGYDIAGPCLWGCYMSWVHNVNAEYIGYMWPIMTFMNMQTLPNRHELNFQTGEIDGFSLDTGCFSYYYFESNPTINVRFMRAQLDVNRTGFPYPFIFNLNDPQNRPVENTLYKAIVRNQPLDDWGSFQVPAWMLPRFIQDKAVLDLALSQCEDIQFFENFTFLHYGRGSLYHGSEKTHSHKAVQIKKFLIEIGVL